MQEGVRPARDVRWFWRESEPAGLGAVVLGGGALALVVLGSIFTLVTEGLTPHESLASALASRRLHAVLLTGIALGVAAVALGSAAHRRMPTKLAREEAVSGAVLGAQAAAVAGLALVFLRGRVDIFTRNILDFEVLAPHVDAFLAGAKNTVFLAFVSEALGIVLGLVLALFAISKRVVVRAPARLYINFFRGTPLIWQLSFLYFAIALGTGVNFSAYTTAIIVFALNTGAYAAEVFRAGIQSIERGQLEAARGLGMSYVQAMRYAVVPQAFRRVIPPLMNEFVILIKDTSLVIVLGLTEAQRELMSVGQDGYANSFNATFFVGTALGYLVVTLPLIRLVNALEARLRSGLIGVTGG